MSSNALFNRGLNHSTPFSRALFVLCRALDLPVEYAILLGGTSHRTILLAMALISFIKHTHWATRISQESMSPRAALFTGISHSFGNLLNTVLFVATSRDGDGLPVHTIIGMAIFILGILVEWGSEIQRLRFKKDVKNRGRVYTKGLFGLTRHINYTGYLLWRTGFALAAAGWVWALVTCGLGAYKCLTSIIPELDEYCEKKYTNQWTKYKEDVPYKLFPFIL
ncbi:MAG: hypothetical protein NXY57DRAFT_195091 [Lentinula lateritia]|nr:hypothetical protein EV359DRAFT_60929 [Lentinula novae-zelandiae]KAJ3931637.1 MAG: hypothetical protein NXY57DRAFT_195091 [Lentinula lateritia]